MSCNMTHVTVWWYDMKMHDIATNSGISDVWQGRETNNGVTMYVVVW